MGAPRPTARPPMPTQPSSRSLRRRRGLPALAVLAALGAPEVGGAASTGEDLAARLAREAVQAQRVARAVGVHVVDLAGRREVFALEPDTPRILASNAKLWTTAAALVELGPEFRFETSVLVHGEVREGALTGDLAIVGSGDPNLSGRFHDGDALAPFRSWARSLRARGIDRVEGELLLVNGIFAEPRIHPDWPRDQLTAWYSAPVDALTFSDNCVLVRVWPGAQAGKAARVATVPKLDHFRFRNSARTVEGQRQGAVVTRAAGEDTIVVSGSVGVRARPLEVWVAVHDPVAYFAAALRAAFAAEGVTLPKRQRSLHGPVAGVWEVAHVHSSALGPTLAVTNKRSQNLYAESLAKLLGWRARGEGSWENASVAIGGFLERVGLDPATYRVADGSGLSRGNEATPRAVTRLLDIMYFHELGREFLLSLPYSGEEDLSWRRRLATPPYRGNVFAKTGTLRGVSTLSGYVKAASGRVYAFSILLNELNGRGSAREAQDRIVRALVDLG
jgi:serine-type D-Ala-D-Ala carboxypeptidase/endopeptidase (penicillin-binding protein 4)